jgi:hypothetical protein
MTGRGLEFAAIVLILGGSAPLPAAAQTNLRCDQRPIQHATRLVSDGGEARLPALTVTVYDYAHVGEHDIADAERVVDRITGERALRSSGSTRATQRVRSACS